MPVKEEWIRLSNRLGVTQLRIRPAVRHRVAPCNRRGLGGIGLV